MAGNDFDSRCFKCVAEMQQKGMGGKGASVLAGRMQSGLVGQNPDDIYVCPKHI
jgi:hypothetical protein